MFMRYLMFVGVVSIVAAGMAACSPSNTPPTARAVSPGGSSGPIAWDYTMRQYNSIDHVYLEAQLDSMGALGWECFQMHYTAGGPWFFFKRPIEE